MLCLNKNDKTYIHIPMNVLSLPLYAAADKKTPKKPPNKQTTGFKQPFVMNTHLAFSIMSIRTALIFGLLCCFLLVVSHDYVKTLKITFLVHPLLFLLCTFHLSYLLFT